MKNFSFFWWIVQICAITLMACACSGCDEDGPIDPPTPPVEVTIPAGEDGSVEFEISNENGGNSGESTTEPAVATTSEPLEMTISQTSSYTDPDGTVYECEPKAEIVIKANLDTVFVKDIKSLTVVSDDVNVTTSKDGENPVTHTTKQSFDIGGQKVEFDLAYEVYTYVNSQKQNIEMPYIKLNDANFGSAESVDVKSANAVKLSNVSIRPLKPATRTIEVTDSTEYEVTARFNLEAETANLATTTKKTISFEVVYVGVVTETTTYPGAEYSYKLTDVDGNELSNTSFTVAPNETFELKFNQTSSYTDQNGVESATLTSWTKITTPDTLRIQKSTDLAERLDDVVIETKSDVPEGNLPYYKLDKVELDGEVAVAEVYKSKDGKLEVYKATATYKQKAVPVNMDGGEELEFTYVVEYLGKVSIELVDVEYVKEVIWEDAHDNIYTNSQCVVTRKAKYSDGTVVETKFYSTKNFVQYVLGQSEKDSSGEIEYVTYKGVNNIGNTFIGTSATGVPDLEHFSYLWGGGDSLYVSLPAYKGPVGVWTEYKHQDTNELYSESEQVEGCYGKQFGYRSSGYVYYQNDSRIVLRNYNIDLIYKDRFFCIDGKLFTFDPLQHKHSWNVETIETPNRGTCALHTLRADVTWLGRDFVYMVVDTVYVKQ